MTKKSMSKVMEWGEKHIQAVTKAICNEEGNAKGLLIGSDFST